MKPKINDFPGYLRCDLLIRSRSASRPCSQSRGRAAALSCRCASPETRDSWPCLKQTVYGQSEEKNKTICGDRLTQTHRWCQPSQIEPKWSSPFHQWAELQYTPVGLVSNSDSTDRRFLMSHQAEGCSNTVEKSLNISNWLFRFHLTSEGKTGQLLNWSSCWAIQLNQPIWLKEI